MLLILAQTNATNALPQLGDWMVWGPLGAFFCWCLWLGTDYYRSEVKPRAKQNREQSREAHVAHVNFVTTTATCLPEIKDTLKVVASRQDEHRTEQQTHRTLLQELAEAMKARACHHPTTN